MALATLSGAFGAKVLIASTYAAGHDASVTPDGILAICTAAKAFSCGVCMVRLAALAEVCLDRAANEEAAVVLLVPLRLHAAGAPRETVMLLDEPPGFAHWLACPTPPLPLGLAVSPIDGFTCTIHIHSCNILDANGLLPGV